MTMANNTAAQTEMPVFYLKEEHHPETGTMLGFWIYLMSDSLIFGILFATYAVIGQNYAAGPAPTDLFDLELVAINTSMLLFSSITYGFAMLQMEKGSIAGTQLWLAITGLFGAAFVGLELYEFHELWSLGATLMIQVAKHGLIPANKRRLMCLSMFWHFLDVIWIGVFSVVYLLGVLG